MRRTRFTKLVAVRLTRDDYRSIRQQQRRDEQMANTLRRLLRAGLEMAKTAETAVKTEAE